jgi:hypothetical protein
MASKLIKFDDDLQKKIKAHAKKKHECNFTAAAKDLIRIGLEQLAEGKKK